MLRSLHIKNYILIDSLDIDFPEGLIIITGQTGAGKSILMGALSLLFGSKADASTISEGAESCVVEAEFTMSSGGQITIRRIIYPTGRSRSFVNDCPVQVSVLQKMADKLVDIHSQHKSLLLADSSFQLSVLDYFAGSREELLECRRHWGLLQTYSSELKQLRLKQHALEADRDYNEAQFRQLEAAGLRSGELEALEEEHKSLSNAELITESLLRAYSELDSQTEAKSVTASIKDAARALERISSYIGGAEELVNRLESSRMELEDIVSEIDSLSSSIGMSPERLEEVENRLSLLYSLLKKHSCRNIDELIDLREKLDQSLYDSTALLEEISAKEEQVRLAQTAYDDVCIRLSAKRKAAAPELASSILESLRFLELDRASFDVRLETASPSLSGTDKVSFLFSSTGRELQELSKVASGGEISRIMLCLKALMAKFVGMPTLVFDEIDTGVSGSVADKMGQMICEMGHDMQVFSITHLPQVAAKGHAHYLVSKSIKDDDRIVSTILRIDGEERINEIARLLSGSTITEAALANAKALLEEGGR